MASAWSQLDQLLTCAICLDRYRNPKLLPCQHTFCMDPCLEGLIDYARRQIKCPECRAEHRIPYQGVQAFPTNVTLVRFLELHRDITGEEPEPPPSMMERCTVCSEKSYLDRCAHCDKKICQDCKEAHADVLRREINRINTQVRRGLSKLSDALAQTNKNVEKLKQNCHLVKSEIEELVRRYTKDIKDTEDKLKYDLDVYIQTEMKNLTKLKDDLDVEVGNINSNCELVDKYICDTVEWTDAELVEYKDIFLKTLEFLRNFDPDTSDYARKVRFAPKADPDVLHRTLSDFGELKINAPLVAANLNLMPPQGNALMRSQSDHRLASQFQRRQEGSRSYLDVSQRLGGHASDSERDPREPPSSSPLFGRMRREFGDSNYRRYGDRGARDEYGESREVGRSRYSRDDGSRWREGDSDYTGYRSRYGRDSGDYTQDVDHHASHTRTVRFEEPSVSPQRERLLEVDNSTKGPLSGIIKLLDSSYIMERLRQNEIKQKHQEKEKEKTTQETPTIPTPTPVPQPPPRRTTRQLSEDEIEKQKRQNQQQTAPTTPTAVSSPTPARQSTPTPPHSPITDKPVLRRLATLQKEEEKRTETSKIQRQNSSSPDTERLSSSRRGSQQDDTEAARSRRRSTDTDATLPGSPQSTPESPKPSRFVKPTLGKTVSLDTQDEITHPVASSRMQEQKEEERKLSESPRAVQSSFYGRLSAYRRPEPQPQPKEEPKTKENEQDDEEDESEESESESESESEETSSESNENDKEAEINKPATSIQNGETSSSTSSESKEEEEEEDEDEIQDVPSSRNSTVEARRENRDYSIDSNHVTSKSNSHSNYNREANNDKDYRSYSRDKNDDSHTYNRDKNNFRKYSWEKDNDYRNYNRDKTDSHNSYKSKWWESKDKKDDYVPKYSSTLSNRRRSVYDDDDDEEYKPYSRFLARSRSSALLGKEDSPPEDSYRYRKYNPTVTNLRRNRIARSKSSHDIGFGEESAEEDVSTSTYKRSVKSPESSGLRTRSHVIKNREASPEEEERPSWSRYLRNKYGTNTTSHGVARSRSSHAICSRSASENSSEDEYVPPSSRRRESINKINESYMFSNPRSTYVQKKRMVMKIGTRGTEPGKFTWPRGVSVGPDNSIVVADSSNHRVQVFDANGKFQQEFGSYGCAEGEFDCLAGVVVNRIGQFIVSDRYNHRIQVFDPSGRFLRSFGCEGRTDGRFSYPWGITTDSLGFIYICDKENHRVQVYQSDGTFVGKFGTIGTRPGQLEHPHYIAVTNTNRVVVSDTNNHRIQVFDVNGRSLSIFGTEGSDDGQFKFPRGIAVDDQGYIIVGDSGNNRIQIFHPDGTFLKSFGTWGSSDGEFKGLEGIAVTSSGNILVCDRENHRIQVF